MKKIIILEYAYKEFKGKVFISKSMSINQIKKICLKDAIEKGATILDDVKILKREDFKYERI